MTMNELRNLAEKKVKPRKISKDCYVASVASALLTEKGNVYIGVCIDTPSSMGFCAEHSAIAQMITNEESSIKMIVAVGKKGILPPQHFRFKTCKPLIFMPIRAYLKM